METAVIVDRDAMAAVNFTNEWRSKG